MSEDDIAIGRYYRSKMTMFTCQVCMLATFEKTMKPAVVVVTRFGGVTENWVMPVDEFCSRFNPVDMAIGAAP